MKNLCAAKIKEITCGAAWIGEADGMLVFHRFTKEQEAFYARRNPQYAGKVASTAGVRCLFKTDSKRLQLRIHVQPGTTRRYFAMDVTVNGKYVGSLHNFDGVDLQTDYTAGDFPLGDFEGEFALGDGEKEVAILFPWSVEARLSALALARYDARTSGLAPANQLDVFLDEHFDNARMERVYPNAKKTG